MQDWGAVQKADTTCKKVEEFQSILDNLLNKNFKWKTTKRRKQDKPSVNDKVRWLTGKSRRLYDREGRSRRWVNLKKKIAKITKKRAKTYMANIRTNMTGVMRVGISSKMFRILATAKKRHNLTSETFSPKTQTRRSQIR